MAQRPILMPAASALPSIRTRMPQASAAALIAALHVAVLWLIWRSHADVAAAPDVFVSLLSFVPPKERSAPLRPAPPLRAPTRVHPAARAPLVRAPQQAALPDLPPMARPSPLLPEPDLAPKPPPSSARVDWSREAQQAAATVLDREQQLGQKRDALIARVRPSRPGEPSPDLRAGFRWNRAVTHRIEISHGLPAAWHINDRCIIIIPLPIPICAIGHIEIHGDLFQDMQQERDAQSVAPGPLDAP